MKTETAYSYLRFSRPEQMKGDSLRRQISQTEELCRRNGWVLDSTLTDKGLSAWSGKNARQGALSVFLAGIESGKIATPCVLVVEQIDRITRQRLLTPLPYWAASCRRASASPCFGRLSGFTPRRMPGKRPS